MPNSKLISVIFVQEWFATHIDSCVPTAFAPLFKKSEVGMRGVLDAGPGLGPGEAKGGEQVRVRYCATYPEIPLQDRKKAKGEGGWERGTAAASIAGQARNFQ
jgi:hypothetical protein